MKTSEHEVDFGSKSSRASLLNKKNQSPFETSNERSLDDVPSDDNNEVVRVPMNAEKYRSHKRSVARYATLKLDGVQGSQVPRRQEHNLPPNIEASNEKRSKQLLERQPRKKLSSQNDDGESVTP